MIRAILWPLLHRPVAALARLHSYVPPRRFPGEPLRSFRGRQIDAVAARGGWR